MQNWQRNFQVVWVAELVALMGWGFIQPFLPYFIQDLGVTDLAQVEFYSGLTMSVHAVAQFVVSPIWGALSDRYGRKIMVERSLFSGTVLYFLMSQVQDIPSLLLIRLLTGALTGSIAAATTLVATQVPKERTGYALGMLQVAVYVGALLGPPMGGLVAEAYGYRAAMMVTSILWLGISLLVHFRVTEDFHPIARKAGSPGGLAGMREVLRSASMTSILAVRMLTRTGDRVMLPVMPLFVQSLAWAGAPVASITGLVTGAGAAASAVGAAWLGRLSDRKGTREVLLICSLGAVAAFVPHYFVTDVIQLTVLQVIASFFLGGTLTAVSSMLARTAPEGRVGVVYGLDHSAASVGNAVGPMLGAAIAMTMGIRSGFLVVAGLFLVSGLAAVRLAPGRPRGPQAAGGAPGSGRRQDAT